MAKALQITAANPDPGLFDLPWDTPLEDWPPDRLAILPQGISRHIVRFVKLSGQVLAVKEIAEKTAHREYELLRALTRLNVPCVEPIGVVTDRTSPTGEPLDPALVTRHLQFSLPYRALFSQTLRPDTATRLIDSLAVLFVRLHLSGFYWGDVSLSNTLFRRDAGEFAAYLVDAETGDLHPSLTDGQRAHDLEIARINIIGELMDLQNGDLLDAEDDPIAIGDLIVERYHDLWDVLTKVESINENERWRVNARIQRLNDIGFDVEEISMTATGDGSTVRIQPRVVESGHHSRLLLRLTGLDVEDHQAQRMLNDMSEYAAQTNRQDEDLEFIAHDWSVNVFEPVVSAVPKELRGKLEPAQIFHEVLEHRWYMAQKLERDVSLEEAEDAYINDILVHRPDEELILGMDSDLIPQVGEL